MGSPQWGCHPRIGGPDTGSGQSDTDMGRGACPSAASLGKRLRRAHRGFTLETTQEAAGKAGLGGGEADTP